MEDAIIPLEIPGPMRVCRGLDIGFGAALTRRELPHRYLGRILALTLVFEKEWTG